MRFVTVWSLLLSLAAAAFGEPSEVVQKKHEEMLYPVVRVTVGSGGGSGTVLYSEDRGDGCQTYVLTNHHVVDAAIKVEKTWSSLLQMDVKREVNDPIKVEVFRYSDGFRQDVCDSYRAEIVAHDKDHDLALVKIQTSRKLDYVAKLLPKDTTVTIFEPAWSVGCSLLHPPVAADGMVTYLDDVIDRKLYWMASAPIIFGNSGGAMFVQKNGNFFFVGVPSRVGATHSQAVEHMAYFVPASRVRKWLADEHLTFLVDVEKTPSECFAARKDLRQKAEMTAAKAPKSD